MKRPLFGKDRTSGFLMSAQVQTKRRTYNSSTVRPPRIRRMDANPQQQFWSGSFGDEYISRNVDESLLLSNVNMFSRILSHMPTLPERVLEFGANVGMNYLALSRCVPSLQFTGVEINATACDELARHPVTAVHSSIEDFESADSWDLVFTKGVLIHLNPESLPAVYEKFAKFSQKYILVAVYYNPSPVSIDYRGEKDVLFKRDFAGEMLDSIDGLNLVDYGFVYRRANFPQDDISWFLMEVK